MFLSRKLNLMNLAHHAVKCLLYEARKQPKCSSDDRENTFFAELDPNLGFSHMNKARSPKEMVET